MAVSPSPPPTEHEHLESRIDVRLPARELRVAGPLLSEPALAA